MVSNDVTKDSYKRGPKDIDENPKGATKDVVDGVRHGVGDRE